MQDMLALNKVQGGESEKFPLSQVKHQLDYLKTGSQKNTCAFISKYLHTTEKSLSVKKHKLTWPSFKDKDQKVHSHRGHKHFC